MTVVSYNCIKCNFTTAILDEKIKHKCNNENEIKMEEEVKDLAEKKITKDVSTKKDKKYGEDVEKKILSLHKSGKTITEICKEFNGHPAIPKIKRILVKAGIEIKKKTKEE